MTHKSGQHRMATGELLDSRGRLVERGWATAEVRRYDRARIKAQPVRIKEWDYYCITTPTHALALTVADNGYVGFVGVSWIDFAQRTAINFGGGKALPMGSMQLPASADYGDVSARHPKLCASFAHTDGGRHLIIDAPQFDNGRGLKGEIRLDQPAPNGVADDRMTIATPFANKPTAFYYNQKINCMPARGEITVGDTVHRFDPASAFGVLDWGRGVWTYDNSWYWGSASGLVDGQRFGFNIGYGFGDTSAATENMVFVDGRAHKLADITFHLPEGAPDSAPWRFTSSDGRFEMTFEPIIDRADKIDLAIFKTDQHQVFGRFSGTVILDDGTQLKIHNLIGFAEKVRNRW